MEIDSEEENTALAEKINNRGYTDKNMNFWIGLTDVDNEGIWKLASDNSIATYLNWGDGQPNNLRAMRIVHVLGWADLNGKKNGQMYPVIKTATVMED